MNVPSTRADALAAFEDAAGWFLAVVAEVRPEQWDRPGLGVWTVRELAGHTGRALVTVEEYLTVPGPGAEAGADTITDADPVLGAATYFLGLRDNARLQQDVAERGRIAGAELGAHGGGSPHDDLAALAQRVIALVRAAPADAVFSSRFGPIPFATYLLTRTVELVVHTVDLARACGLALDVPHRAASVAVAVVGQLAVERGSGGEVLTALGGRAPLAEGFGVFT
jgi:uncharacterized protein (TIGR03083 family)